MLQTIFKIGTEEGPANLFKGLTPGLHRQFVNCSIRFGMYEHVRDFICGELKPGQNPPLVKKILAAFLTGTFSILFANPFDVAKVRMQALARAAGPGGKIPRAS
jgi:solute carrier family 25 uncoupling protein 8/9